MYVVSVTKTFLMMTQKTNSYSYLFHRTLLVLVVRVRIPQVVLSEVLVMGVLASVAEFLE